MSAIPLGWLHAGTVGRPHGLDGSFHVVAAKPQLLHAEGVVMLSSSAEQRRIVRRAGTDLRPILRIDGCGDRESAQALAGAELLVARTDAPALEPDEWWAEDLEGCVVSDGARRIGAVRRLLALPSCEVLEVVREEGGTELLVPLVADAVRAVDLERRWIDVDLAFLGEE